MTFSVTHVYPTVVDYKPTSFICRLILYEGDVADEIGIPTHRGELELQ